MDRIVSGKKDFFGVSDVSSGERRLSYGVPQASILSPLLFLIYVNYFGSLVHNRRSSSSQMILLSFSTQSQLDM